MPESKDLVCFIDSCINCGSGDSHLLSDDKVTWSERGDALCPECWYERGVYSATVCCAKETAEK